MIFKFGEGVDVDCASGANATTLALGPNVDRAPGSKSKLMAAAVEAGLSGDEWMGV